MAIEYDQMVIKYRIAGGRKMFDKLEDLVKRLDEVMQELSEPDVVSDQNRFRNLMKEQNELAPIDMGIGIKLRWDSLWGKNGDN